MEKYCRTTSGDFWEFDGFKYKKPHCTNYLLGKEGFIVSKADAIADLLMVGDLVIYHVGQFNCDVVRLIKDQVELEDIKYIIKNNPTLTKCEIRTLQNRDFILVAEIVNGGRIV